MQNRRKSNIILMISFILFILINMFSNHIPFANLTAYIAEAALIGGIADWFAVTALFKRPLGFKWHTAIIPNSRNVIIEKLSSMVGNELLSVESIKLRFDTFSLADLILDKFTETIDRPMLENMVMNLVKNKTESLDAGKITADINSFVKKSLEKESVSGEIRNMLDRAFKEDSHREWILKLVKKALEIAAKTTTREKIHKILMEQQNYNESANNTGAFIIKTVLKISQSGKHTNLYAISELIQKELIEVLVQISRPDNPVFMKLAENFKNTYNRLDGDDILVPVIQEWKNGILEKVDLVEALQNLVSSLIESQIRRNEAAGWIAEHLGKYKENLKQDDEMRKWIDDVLKTILEKIIRNEHYLIGEIAKETLESYTNDRLVDFFEAKVGNDLQWIRINGSIVGAAAGLLIYLFTNLLYIPYVVPFIQGLFM